MSIIDIMADIFRKRPILGKRVLVPMRDEIEEADYRLISMWEAEKRCNYVKHSHSHNLIENVSNCESIEISPNGGTKHCMWKCRCPIDHRFNRLKQRFNLD